MCSEKERSLLRKRNGVHNVSTLVEIWQYSSAHERDRSVCLTTDDRSKLREKDKVTKQGNLANFSTLQVCRCHTQREKDVLMECMGQRGKLKDKGELKGREIGGNLLFVNDKYGMAIFRKHRSIVLLLHVTERLKFGNKKW